MQVFAFRNGENREGRRLEHEMTVAITFIVLMIAGGVIAYLGDDLGYRIGKKRLTILRFRPRHTAQIITVISGTLIAAGALLVLLVLNRDFRTALVRGRVLVERNEALKVMNAHLEQHAEQLTTKASDAVAAADDAERQAGAARSSAKLDLAELNRVELSLRDVHGKLALAQADLQQKRVNLAQVAHSLDVTQAEKERLADQVNKIRLAMPGLQANFNAHIKNAVIYRDGEEVGRVAIDASDSRSIIHDELVEFLYRLSGTAGQSGAARGQTGRAVEIASVKIFSTAQSQNHPGPHPAGGARFADEQANLDALTDVIHTWKGGHGSVAVLAYALGNSFAGKPVVVELLPFANKLVYPKGSVVSEITVSGGNRPVSGILSDIQAFLMHKVRPTAMADGVIPIIDPQEHSVELGDLPITDLFDVVQNVQGAKGDVFLKAVTTADIYSADKLQVKIEVDPVPEVHVSGGAAT